MKIRESLENCRSMAREVALLSQAIELAEARIPMFPNGSTSAALGRMRGGNDSTSAAIAKIEGLEKWLRRDQAELLILSAIAECIIAPLNEQERHIMRAYYIQAKTDSETACEMGYHFRQTVQSKRSEILQELETGG